MGSPRSKQRTRTVEVEWVDEDGMERSTPVTFRPLTAGDALDMQEKAVVASDRGVKVNVGSWQRERLKRMVKTVDGEAFRDAMLMEWPESFYYALIRELPGPSLTDELKKTSGSQPGDGE